MWCWGCLSQNVQCHSLAVVMEKMWWDSCLSTQNVQCHSLPVGHKKRYDETAFHKMCNLNVTHKLLVIRKKCDEIAFHKMCNVTHFLFTGKYVMRLPLTKCATSLTSCWSYEKMWWNCLSQNVQCHSLSVGHGKRCDETGFHKMCNVTHNLFVIGKDVIRLPFTKCTVSPTFCWW